MQDEGAGRGWPAGYDRVVLEEVDSTLDEARRRANNVSDPLWIMAMRQTAARARRGRKWIAPEGNLAATLILPRPGSPLQAAQRSFVAALALFNVLRKYVEPEGLGQDVGRVRLKWPNDVLVDDRKIAGILLEAHGAGPDHLAIGLGVNIAAAPSARLLESRAVAPIALSEVCDAPSAEEFLTELAMSYAFEEMWYQTAGFARTRRTWLRHAARLGETIIVRTGDRETTGTFVDVDSEGQLVLETAEGRVPIPAAEIYF